MLVERPGAEPRLLGLACRLAASLFQQEKLDRSARPRAFEFSTRLNVYDDEIDRLHASLVDRYRAQIVERHAGQVQPSSDAIHTPHPDGMRAALGEDVPILGGSSGDNKVQRADYRPRKR